MGMLGRVRGGDRRILPYVKRDVSNFRSKLRQNLNLRDMDFTIQYFERRQAENPQFYYAKTVDKETNSVTGLFWVDGRARALYPKYKDCIFFDTTFCINRYNMLFALIVGVNNHLQMVLLGCALLPNEQIENFKWVFQHFLLAMNNEHPLNIMIDQDKAMETAISQALPNTVHRCCKWHVQRKAREKLGRIMSRDEVFEQAFYTFINDSDTVDEFEENWQHMIHCFDLVDNRHLCNMWKTRRSEGLNSYFKTFVNPQDSVWRFVQHYEVLQETMLDREDNQAFIGAATTTPLYSRYRIERQAVGFYTRNVFGKFQAEVTASTGFVMNQVPSPDIGSMRFELFSNYYEDPKIFTVNVVLAEETFECSCNCFEMNGIICAHIVRVMVHLNVQAIPQRYLLERWSERATTPTGGSGHLLDFALPSNNTLKYNLLCRKFTWLASQACSNDVACKILNDAAHALEPIILAARRGELPEQQEAQQQQPDQHQSTTQGGRQQTTMHQRGPTHQQKHPQTQQQQTPLESKQQQPKHPRKKQLDCPTQQQQAATTHVEHDTGEVPMLQNPARVPKKGQPTEKSKRRKTLLEQREDAQKKKAKTDKKKKETKPKRKPGPKKKTDIFSYCKEDDHSVVTCELLKAAMAVQKCNYYNEPDHAVKHCPYLRAAMSMEAGVSRATELRL
ncbi:protein FAR1-RELATED SEQUENCE 9-like [Aegilops tauschii subsp. strangulata]|uniref:protein FAR1-RELATED SEQUENCE 9-like n=1 Tax=Aegilops tauschii subsp. strangulata TaxID=200361 RepID=UPI00098A37D7|nr:protein FAR1-RELATED SEQUENCE 3-like [Aegilops tauschii subsp. strangulata]